MASYFRLFFMDSATIICRTHHVERFVLSQLSDRTDFPFVDLLNLPAEEILPEIYGFQAMVTFPFDEPPCIGCIYLSTMLVRVFESAAYARVKAKTDLLQAIKLLERANRAAELAYQLVSKGL